MSFHKHELYGMVSTEDVDSDQDNDIEKYETKQPIANRSPLFMTHPSFMFFASCLLISTFCALFWIFDTDIRFLIVGIIGLTVFLFGFIRFYMLFKTKRYALDITQDLHHKLKVEKLQIQSQIQRVQSATLILRDAKHRITRITQKQKNNYILFENMEQIIKHAGIKPNICDTVSNIQTLWEHEHIQHETTTLKTVYNRFIQNKNKTNNDVLNREEFSEFIEQIPVVYRAAWTHDNIFNELDTEHIGFITVRELETCLNGNMYNTAEMDDGKPKESLFSVDYDIGGDETENEDKSESESDCDGYDDIDEEHSDAEMHFELQPLNEENRKQSLFPADYDISGGDNAYEKRKIGRLRIKWDQKRVQQQDSNVASLRRKKVSEDKSWIRQKSQKRHIIHDSVDELRVNKLVSLSQGKYDQGNTEKIKFIKPTRKGPTTPDDSWVKHQSKSIHPVHDSVEVLSMHKLVSNADIINILTTVSEDAE